MRIGPIEIKATEHRIPDTEIGVTGTAVKKGTAASVQDAPGVGYVADEEYLPELQGEALYTEFDKMRKSDSQVIAALRAVKLPLLGAEFRVDAASEDAPDVEIAEWVADVLFERQSISWLAVMRNNLLKIEFGAAVDELVWRIVDDPMLGRPAAVIHKMAPRIPSSIREFRVDEHGGLEGVIQRGSEQNEFSDTSIPVKENGVQKLLIYVNEQEGSGFRGVSMLRAARRDWFYKSKFYALLGIIYEKRGAGIDVGKLTRSTPSRRAAAVKVLMGVRTNPRAYVLENPDFEYRVEGVGAGGIVSPLEGMIYADTQIVRGMLVEWLSMGDTEGARAVHTDKTSLYMQNEATILDESLGVMNRHMVPDLVDLNFAGVKKYPKIARGRLDRRDLTATIEALKELIPIDAIRLFPGLVTEIHSMLELPQPPDGLLDEDLEPEPEDAPDQFVDVPAQDNGDLRNDDVGDVDPELLAIWAGERTILADRRGEERRLRRVWEKRLRAEGRAAATILSRGGAVADVNLNLIGRYGIATADELAEIHRGVMRGPDLRQRPAVSDRYAKKRARRILNGMSRATKTALSSTMRRLESGATPPQIRAAVRGSYAFSPSRAKDIALNEVKTARADGELIAATGRSKAEKHWTTKGDDRVDANGPTPCIDNEAQGWIPIAAEFVSGDDTNPAHNRCRCVVTFR